MQLNLTRMDTGWAIITWERRALEAQRYLSGRHGWKYRLLIYYCRCFAFNFFYRLSPFLCFLLTCYRLVESLYFTFVLVESVELTSFHFSYTVLLFIIIVKVYFLYPL